MGNKRLKLLILGLLTIGVLLLFVVFSWQEGPVGNNKDIMITSANAEQSAAVKKLEKGSTSENLVIPLCDGETRMEVTDVKAGEVLPLAKARQVALLMKEAYAAEQAKQVAKWTKRDRLIWEREQKRTIEEGNRLFHDWKAIGGTTGISCDMCHPNASNTHPETYPKFQTQLKKVSALRDMINWCIENPVKGKPLALDDPKMIALEAYITNQRKGTPLDPGKH